MDSGLRLGLASAITWPVFRALIRSEEIAKLKFVSAVNNENLRLLIVIDCDDDSYISVCRNAEIFKLLG